MQKKVLAIYFSQSGQLENIISNFCAPLEDAGMLIDKVRIDPVHAYPFPWTTVSFFNVMPESVMAVPVELKYFSLQHERYDLIVLGYQAWFLSLSVPALSLLRHPGFRKVLNNSPVITITGARNMWVSAFDKLRKELKTTGCFHAGNIVLVDKHLNLISIFSIFHWMLRGTKSQWLGIFPLPGVSSKDILNTKDFGSIVLPYVELNQWEGLQPALIKANAAVLKFHLVFIEMKAAAIFKIWAKKAIHSNKRNTWLKAFRYYLFVALFLVAPLIFIIDLIFFKPFLFWYVKKQKDFYNKLN